MKKIGIHLLEEALTLSVEWGEMSSSASYGGSTDLCAYGVKHVVQDKFDGSRWIERTSKLVEVAKGGSINWEYDQMVMAHSFSVYT